MGLRFDRAVRHHQQCIYHLILAGCKPLQALALGTAWSRIVPYSIRQLLRSLLRPMKLYLL